LLKHLKDVYPVLGLETYGLNFHCVSEDARRAGNDGRTNAAADDSDDMSGSEAADAIATRMRAAGTGKISRIY
jgi:hypothetical protein